MTLQHQIERALNPTQTVVFQNKLDEARGEACRPWYTNSECIAALRGTVGVAKDATLAAKDAEIAELREKLDQYADDVYEIASSGKEYHRFFLQQHEVIRIQGYAFDGGNTGAIVSVYAKPMEPTVITKATEGEG